MQRIDSFETTQIVQLKLIFYSDFLLPLLFSFQEGSPWHADESLLLFYTRIVHIPILSLPTQIEHAQRINQQILFDLFVQGGFAHKTGRLIHFYEPWARLSIQKDVNAQYLTAQLIFEVLRLRGAIDVHYVLVTRNYRLDTQLFHLGVTFGRGYYFRVFLSSQINLFEDRSHGPLMADVVSCSVLVCHKLVTLLINGIVCQVHLQVVQIAVQRRDVLLSGETGQPFFE